MKKALQFVLAAFLLTGCSSTATSAATASASAETTVEIPADISILAPTGAPGYSLVGLAAEGIGDLTLVDGSDVLQAAFVSETPEYDIIIAPTNLGVKLASAGSTTYRLAAIVTTGNLYIVGTEDTDLESADTSIAVFGETAVPGLVYSSLFADTEMTETWYSSVTEAQTALLSGQADCALLAEPAATATIAKANENGVTLTKLADLQELWGDDGYPMAGLFVQEDAVEDNADVYLAVVEMMQEYAAGVEDGTVDVAADLDSLEDPTIFGATASAMVAKTYTSMGIDPYLATEDEDNLQAFLTLFGVTVSDDAIVSLTD